MVDCLFDEVYLGQHEDTLHDKEVLEELFRYFASHDPRFNKVGLSWNPKGYVQYEDGHGGLWVAETAIAVFLGLALNARGYPTVGSIDFIYRKFGNLVEARVWLRWHVQKMFGFTRKERDMWTDYPRVFPTITNEFS